MDEKPNYFLREFLNPIRKTDDNLSIRLSILFTLKHIAPKKFRELKLNEDLESVISDINEIVEKPTSLLGSVISKMRRMLNKQKSVYDLQAKLDYWYYTKLLGYGDRYRVNDEMIKISMTDEKIKNVTHPRDAVLIYIYIRALSYCDS